MAGKKNQLKQGIQAMFTSATEAPHEELKQESAVSEKREPPYYLRGRRKKDDMSELLTKDDERTTLVLNKSQYAVIKEIARRERVTIKNLVSQIFDKAIRDYERKNGKVELTDERCVRKIF